MWELTSGHARQLASVLRGRLATLCRRVDLSTDTDARVFIDIDSLLGPVYGHARQGASYGHRTSDLRNAAACRNPWPNSGRPASRSVGIDRPAAETPLDALNRLPKLNTGLRFRHRLHETAGQPHSDIRDQPQKHSLTVRPSGRSTTSPNEWVALRVSTGRAQLHQPA